METRKFGEPKTRKLDNPKFKEEEEALRKRFTEQVKLEESRFRQWEQRVPYPNLYFLTSLAHRRTRSSQQGFGIRTCHYQVTRTGAGDHGWK
jgi:septin family protein